MKRRSFLQFLGLSPIVAKIAPTLTKKTPNLSPIIEKSILPPVPKNLVSEVRGTFSYNTSGNLYVYVRAATTFEPGQLCYYENRPIGVAVNEVYAGNYGVVQTYGPFERKIS